MQWLNLCLLDLSLKEKFELVVVILIYYKLSNIFQMFLKY